jgi:hypothetical protein
VAVHCEEAHAIVLPPHQQAEAVVFDFVESVRTVWNFGPTGRQAEPKLRAHARQVGIAGWDCDFAARYFCLSSLVIVFTPPVLTTV